MQYVFIQAFKPVSLFDVRIWEFKNNYVSMRVLNLLESIYIFGICQIMIH